MNIIFDVRLDSKLCPKCYGPAEFNENGDLECEWDECGYVYFMFAEDKNVNIFQLELDF